MLVSIVIPAYNAASTLGSCLQACLDQTHSETEVIVVDDGSTDDTPRIAQSFPVHYIRQDNAGPATARNHGAKMAKGSIIACTDADCVPQPDWIEALLRGFEEGTVAVGGAYANADDSSLLARMVHEEIALRHEGFGEEVDFLGSFNVAYDKAAFDAVGGFDESFPTSSAEDNDLSYRLADGGGVLRFAPEAGVAHHHPTRLWPYLRTQCRHGYWRMKLYAKHPRRAAPGDQYAGFSDLARPPLALLVLACLPAAVLGVLVPSLLPWIAIATLALLVSYGALQAPLTAHIVFRGRDPLMALFPAVTVLRDVARALGMVCGIWTFLIRKKDTV